MSYHHLPPSISSHSSARKNILLVDDDPGLRATTAFLLVQAGYEVKQAHDARQALPLVRNTQGGDNPYDLIIAGVMMSNLSGMELLSTLRMNGVHLPVLIIVGVLDAVIIEKLHSMGPLEIVMKPFRPEEFIRQVEHLLAGHQRIATRCIYSEEERTL